MPRRVLLALQLSLLFCLLAAPFSLRAGAEGPPPAILAALKHHKLDPADVSIFVQAVDGQEPLIAFHDELPRSPASVVKLLTTYAALDILGPAFQWHTEIWTTGTLRDGRLDGDLILRGGGDPGLSTERFWTLLREIRARGITEITGDLVIDDTLFAPAEDAPGDFDQQPWRAYNVPPNALLVNHNAVEIRLTRNPGGIGTYVDPPLHDFRLENRLTSRPGACSGYQRGVAFDLPAGLDGRHAVLSGAFPGGCTDHTLWRAVLPAPQFADALFRELWPQLGGQIRGKLRVEAVPEGATRLFVYRSLPLAEQVRQINKWSNNPMTRHLLLTIGIDHAGAPGTTEKGRAALAAWAERRGLEFPDMFIDNGSGLSRRTRMSAGGLGRMLLDAWEHPQMAELMSSMPIAALDGTLRSRYHGEMAGRMYLKTGRLDNVSAIAGFVSSRSGRRHVVVVIVNAPGAHEGSGAAIQDAVLRWTFDR
jgi:serine-type D-Ala-D-Ala carboxypeptidase/endopeptidase (penicillin-binding protein 4)